jgi:RNA polymerase sigma factor (sigma-70 family)
VYAKVQSDRHLAEDIVGKAVLALIKAAADPEFEVQNLGGWLRTVASNKIADHFRAAARVQHLIDDAK